VRAFYAFWQAFDSWREFPSEDADQLWDDLSMTREERRWHERQARKDQARRRQAERARLRQLVETSYRLDPRVRRIREVERARKAQERAARRRFRQQWLADEERLQSKILHPRQDTMGSVGEDAGHETAISDDEEAVVPAVLSTASDAPTQKCLGRNSSLEPTLANRAPASTIATSSSEQRSLPACRLSAGNARETTQLARTDKRPESLTLPRLERTDPEKHQGASGATAAPEASPLASNGRVDHANAQRNRDAAGTSPKTQWPGTQQAGFTNADPMTPTTSSDSQSSAPNESWSSTEYALLTRALKKYPVGTRDRWERIAELLQHRYSPEVIRAQAQALMRAPHSAASTITPPNAAAWTVTEQRQLEEALRQIGPSHGAARWRLVANHVPTRSAAACAARFAELRTFYTSTGAVSSTTPSTASTARKTSSVAASVSRGC
jgi:DnaJ family protein C protein 2